MRRVLVLVFPVFAGCPDAPPPPAQPPAAHTEPDTAWVKSDKLDADLQELVLRAYEVDLAFPFRIRKKDEDGGVTESVERVRPSDLAAFVRDDRVLAVRCATPPTEQFTDDGWRAKIDPDVRTVLGAHGACWTALALRFEHEPSADEWREAEDAGVVVYARDARSALVWAPIRTIPRLAMLAFVAKVEPFDRDPD